MNTLTLSADVRPNFMKIAPLIRAIQRRREVLRYRLVHTAQHYDRDMNDIFFGLYCTSSHADDEFVSFRVCGGRLPGPTYRLRNYQEYNAALVKRGSLTLWMNEKVLSAWHDDERRQARRSAHVY